MSRGPWLTSEIVQRVREINDEHPGRFYHEIAKYVGISDSSVRAILRDEYEIDGDKVIRIYKHQKKETKAPEKVSQLKQLLNALYGSKAFPVTLNDIYLELKEIREILSDLRDTLKEVKNDES